MILKRNVWRKFLQLMRLTGYMIIKTQSSSDVIKLRILISTFFFLRFSQIKHLISFLCFPVNKIWVHEIWKITAYYFYLHFRQHFNIWLALPVVGFRGIYWYQWKTIINSFQSWMSTSTCSVYLTENRPGSRLESLPCCMVSK